MVHAQWTSDATMNTKICDAIGQQATADMMPDGAGGAFIAWYDNRSGAYDIYIQRINAAGVAQWTNNGVAVCTRTEAQVNAKMTSDGAGGVIVSWGDNSVPGSPDIWAQRINANGVAMWAANGVPICTAQYLQSDQQIISDGAGGAILTWWDHRLAGVNYDLYAQRVNANGVVQWTANGVAVCTVTNGQGNPTMIPDGAGGAIIAWEDFRDGNYYHVFGQRINSSGVKQWTSTGVIICYESNNQREPIMISDGAGGALVVWYDNRGGANYDVYAQRINSAGVVQWNEEGVAICTGTGDQIVNDFLTDNSGGAYVAWADTRNGNHDIFAQHINGSGASLWTPNGVAVCTAPLLQHLPKMTRSLAGSIIISWYDERGPRADILAQKVNASGNTEWAANGVFICSNEWDQYTPVVVSDNLGGAIIIWDDNRATDGDLYIQNISADGMLGVTANPTPVVITNCAGGSKSITTELTGANYQWQLNTGSGFVNIVNDANYGGTNTATLQLINTPSSWYGNLYRCLTNGASNKTYVLQFANTWLGSVNNDWNNSSNWSCGSLPDMNTDVIVQTGNVVLGSDRVVRKLTLSPGVNFSVSPGVKLTVTH